MAVNGWSWEEIFGDIVALHIKVHSENYLEWFSQVLHKVFQLKFDEFSIWFQWLEVFPIYF